MNVILPPIEADPENLREAVRTRTATEGQALAAAAVLLAVEVVVGLAARRRFDEAARAVLLDVLVEHYRGTLRRLADEETS